MSSATNDHDTSPRLPAGLGPNSFAHVIDDWQIMETHISWVILTGPFAYKIKKPVRFDFVDYHSLALRRHYCQEELRLNRRFCPDLYLSVVPILQSPDGLLVDPPADSVSQESVIEYAVKMRQFPQEQILAAVLLSGTADASAASQAAEFGQDLARRHAELPTLANQTATPPLGSPADYVSGVERDCRDNFDYFLSQPAADQRSHPGQENRGRATPETGPTGSRATCSPAARVQPDCGSLHGSEDEAAFTESVPLTWRQLFEYLERWSGRQLEQVRDALERRAVAGWVRQCHGDLHLRNMLVWQGRWMAFDGIEFNPRFQWIDVFSEVAFLAMDLQAHGRADLGAIVLNRYLETVGDYADLPVLRFFLVYRAMVRAKIGHLKLLQEEGSAAEEAVLSAAVPNPSHGAKVFLDLPDWQRYALVARRLASGHRRKLCIMHGVSGSGKSTIAAGLVAQLRGLRIRSDRLRQQQAPAGEKYSAAGRDQVYHQMSEAAAAALAAGFSVIADATFLKREHRQLFRKLATSQGADFAIIDCQAPTAELERRLRQRAAAGSDPSEATVAVLHRQLAEQEPLSDDERLLLACPQPAGTGEEPG